MDKYFCAFSQQSGMQRCFFLLFPLLPCFMLSGQAVDILHTEVSIYATDTFPDILDMCAVTDLRVSPKEKEVRLDFHPDSLYSVRIRQGRLKDFIPFRREGNEIVLELGSWQNRPERISIAFAYSINLSNPENQAYIRNNVGVLSLNGFNAYNPAGLGISGLFFPSRAEDACTFQVNISVPEDYTVFTIGEPEFRVVDKNITHHFWSSKEPMQAPSFYLITGALIEDELDDIDEVYSFSETNLADIRALNLRNENAELLRILEEETGFSVNDSLLLVADSLSAAHSPDLQVLSSRQSTPFTNLQNWLLLRASSGDSLYATYLGYTYQAAQESSLWPVLATQKYLEEHVNDTLVSPKFLALQTTLWLQGFYPGYDPRTPPDSSAYTNLAESVMNSSALPRLDISYRYSNGIQNIIIKQDTGYVRAFAIPMEVTVYLRDTVIRAERVSQAIPEDRVQIPASASPQAVRVETGKYFPGYVEDNRPDVYNLYQLSNAQTEEERMDALTRLFRTSNTNLFSTTLGIAMDDPNARIRVMALERAGNLNVPAQLKLKDTLLKMSRTDPDPEVQEKAKALVLKYYTQK